MVKGHFNLYYILLEDQKANPMDPAVSEKISKNLENYYKKIKPPWDPNPPNIISKTQT